MLVINKLTRSGGIKSVVIRTSSVVVRTLDGDEIVYERKVPNPEFFNPKHFTGPFVLEGK